MYDEEDLLPVSALQHLAFCERQWALIHLEGIWDENRLTIEGRHLHDRVHEAETEVRGNIRIVSGLRLRSLRLGLTGRADVVEFHRIPDAATDPALVAGFRLGGLSGVWRPLIVEYKRGRPKLVRCDEVQICAQAMCLEEMLAAQADVEERIPSGALFYGTPRRRHEVCFDDNLRSHTEQLAELLHDLTSTARTPPAEYGKKCRNCSLISVCVPKGTGSGRSAQRYLARALADQEEEGA